MSDLQIGLIVLGVLLILLVLGFNWWQDRRVRRRMQTHFPSTEQDPLLGTVAPAGQSGLSGQSGQVGQPGRREPAFGAAGTAATVGESGAQALGADDIDEADPACEVVIDLAFSEPVSGAELLAHTHGMRAAGRKPLRLFAETQDSRHRARLQAGESYASLQIAVLLANRSGPLTAIEWSQVWARAQDLAERFDAAIEGPDQQAVLEQAARLDDTCAALDTQVGLTVMLGRARILADVLDAAREMGFVADGPHLVWPTESGIPGFTLSRGDGAPFDDRQQGVVDRLNLLLDVPCSMPQANAFGSMAQVGRELAAKLEADLVDDQGKPLAPGSEAAIDERLQVLCRQLDQAGLPAGSMRALRVFS